MVIKILYVADTAPPKKDGVVRFMLETYKRLNSEKFEVSFLLPKIEGAEKIARTMNLNVTFVPVRRFTVATYPPAIPKSKIIKEVIENTDVVFINSIAPLGGSALTYANKIGKPVVEFVHSLEWEHFAYATKFPDKYAKVLKPIVRRAYNKSNVLVVANKGIKNSLKTMKLTPKIEVTSLGVDQKKFCFDRIKRVYLRRELKLTNSFVIGYQGRLSREKNIKLLAETFDKINQKIPNSKLIIVGDGLEKKYLKNPNILHIGFVDNPEDYLQVMDMFVLPSMTETTALALMEAMSTGLPCIATNVGAIPSYLKHRFNGILLNKEKLDSTVLEYAILKLYKDARLRKKLGDNAANTIGTAYSWDKTTTHLENIFEEVLNK
jgi:glycosyltransferase involved in cell wall biosynthesis